LSRYLVISAFILSITVILSFCTPITGATVEQDRLDIAQSIINRALNNVLIAEHLGSNVTQLIGKLNNAGELLSNAANTYRSGVAVNVTSMAEKAQLLADEVNNEALNLQITANIRIQAIIIQNLLFTIIGSSLFIILLIFIWRRFKFFYIKRVLDSRPEGVKNKT
jgi:hypothetical protein